MPKVSANTRYADLDFEWAKANDGDLKAETELESVRQSLYSILNTIPGERVMRPDFGADLRQFLFEPFDEYTAKTIGDMVLHSVQNWEPRVVLELVDVNVNYDQQVYEMEVRYRIVNTTQSDTLRLILQKS